MSPQRSRIDLKQNLVQVASIKSKNNVRQVKDKAQAYINGMAEQGAVGFIAGKTIAPMTAGWSLPVMTLAGIGNGALHARTNLALQQSQCEVKAMREKLLKW